MKNCRKKKEKPERSETSFFGTSSPRPSFWQSMRKSIFSTLQTLVGPYSKLLLILNFISKDAFTFFFFRSKKRHESSVQLVWLVSDIFGFHIPIIFDSLTSETCWFVLQFSVKFPVLKSFGFMKSSKRFSSSFYCLVPLSCRVWHITISDTHRLPWHMFIYNVL